jgi:multiple sugar transport system substrate-binding protein
MTSDPVVNGWQLRQDLVWKYHYMAQPSETEAFGGTSGFKNSKIGLYITGAWGWWQFGDLDEQFNWGVAALPYGAEGRKDLIFTDPWLMAKDSNHPEEAWEFIKFLASAETQAEWMELTGAPPVRQSLLEVWADSFETMTQEEVMQVYLGSLDYGMESPNHSMVRFDQLSSVIGAQTSQITNNERPVLEVLTEINTNLEETLMQIKAEYDK